MDLPGVPEPLQARARRGADWVRERAESGDRVTVVHHIDADGVTSGAIALRCLERAGVRHDSVAAKSLDAVHLDALRTGGHEALWFCDFGSTAYMEFPDVPRLVCDHHELVRDGTEEDFPHVNPLLDDLSGGEVSGAGCAFLVAHAVDAANLDLLPTALVGAAADLQDRAPGPDGGFTGTNAALVDAGVAAGLLEVEADLSWFGPETRPLTKFLAYASEPNVPTVTGDRRTAADLLLSLDIVRSDDDGERSWSRLTPDERRRVRSAIVSRWLDCGAGTDEVDALWRPVVRIVGEEAGTPVRELREFGTLLNSTARYGEPEVGLRVAAGDRDKAYGHALELRDGHRRHLASSVSAFVDAGVTEENGIQWCHVQDRVRDTVVGIVCGMALDGLGLRRDRPLVGLAYTDDGRTKISSRAPAELQGRVDLATAMREGAASVGGQGGGHKGAAGATIPREAEQEFLRTVDAIVSEQLGIRSVEAPPAPSTPMPSSPPSAAPPAPPAPPAAAPAWTDRAGQSTLF